MSESIPSFFFTIESIFWSQKLSIRLKSQWWNSQSWHFQLCMGVHSATAACRIHPSTTLNIAFSALHSATTTYWMQPSLPLPHVANILNYILLYSTYNACVPLRRPQGRDKNLLRGSCCLQFGKVTGQNSPQRGVADGLFMIDFSSFSTLCWYS